MAKLDFSGLDNAPCRKLVEAKPGGLFSLLEDECQVPKGSDEGLHSKLQTAYAKVHTPPVAPPPRRHSPPSAAPPAQRARNHMHTITCAHTHARGNDVCNQKKFLFLLN